MREAIPVIVPQMNPNDEHAVLVKWHVTSGSQVVLDQPVAVVETTKATFDVNAPAAGFVFFEHPPSTMVAIGAAIAWISESAAGPTMSAPPPPTAIVATADEGRATRKALRLMRQHGLSEDDFPGSGRIEVEDVERRVQSGKSGLSPATHDDAEPLEQGSSKMLEAARLVSVYREVVPSTVSIAIEESKLQMRLAVLAKEIGPVSVLELAIFELGHVLEDFPELNGYFVQGKAWRYKSTKIGFAVNLGRGLRVPVVNRSAAVSLIEVVRCVRDLSLRYMRDELTMQDVTGGTFTLTDLSAHQVVNFTPVLNERQSAILGICAPRAGTLTRDLILAFDHRMSDGMRAAAFLNALRERLEGEE